MNSLRWLPLVAIVMFAFPSDSEAQFRRGRWYRPPVAGYGYGYGGYSSTPIEGARRGMADVIRAQGEAAVNVTQGMINYEDARSKYIDNKMKWTETYWARKRLGESEIRADYDKKYDAIRRHLATKESGAPPRMTPSQVDPATGKIYWPTALEASVYDTNREKLEELFLLRAHTSRTPDLAAEISNTASEMQDQLKSNIRGMDANEYISARKFLESLAHEGRYAPG